MVTSVRLNTYPTAGKSLGRPTNPMAALPLNELRTHLSPQENAFFDYIDVQLEKVESFYMAREGELSARTTLLKQQLLELQDHSRIVHVCPRQGFFFLKNITLIYFIF